MLLLAAVSVELVDLPGDVVGIGPVNAAARAATILERQKPDAVILIGTGGSYNGGPPIGTAIAANRVGLTWGVAAMGLGYVPRPPPPLACSEDLLDRLEIPRHDVLTTGAITTDLTLASRLGDDWQVEHLEAYGVAYAAHAAQIPFVVVLGISNVVGPDAHTQWLTNREGAQEAARRAVRSLLTS
jgi:purine-nucleoside phosphorylase